MKKIFRTKQLLKKLRPKTLGLKKAFKTLADAFCNFMNDPTDIPVAILSMLVTTAYYIIYLSGFIFVGICFCIPFSLLFLIYWLDDRSKKKKTKEYWKEVKLPRPGTVKNESIAAICDDGDITYFGEVFFFDPEGKVPMANTNDDGSLDWGDDDYLFYMPDTSIDCVMEIECTVEELHKGCWFEQISKGEIQKGMIVFSFSQGQGWSLSKIKKETLLLKKKVDYFLND